MGTDTGYWEINAGVVGLYIFKHYLQNIQILKYAWTFPTILSQHMNIVIFLMFSDIFQEATEVCE